MWRIETISCGVDAEGHLNATIVVEVVNTFPDRWGAADENSFTLSRTGGMGANSVLF
jgi:hypothetical protein